jgi:hypothetical protein
MPKSKTRLKVRKSQRLQTLREYVAVESPILSMPMATKFDLRKKIKKMVKNKRNQNNNLANNFLGVSYWEETPISFGFSQTHTHTNTHTHSQAAIFFKKGVGFTALLFFYLVYVLKEHLSLIKLESSKKSLKSYYQGLKKIDSYLVLLLCLLCWFFSAKFPVLSCTGSSM